jgi:hypothetical protein
MELKDHFGDEIISSQCLNQQNQALNLKRCVKYQRNKRTNLVSPTSIVN